MKEFAIARVRGRLGPLLMRPDEVEAQTSFSLGFGSEERTLTIAEHGTVFRPAAVLVPLVARDGGATVLLTERCADLPNHAGQISFPGGRMEEDDHDLVATALREAEEEVGLEAASVVVLGALPTRGTISNFRVTPIVAIVRPFQVRPQLGEVADVFEVPLDFIFDRRNQKFLNRDPDGRPRQMYAIPYGERFIFGLTARILVQLSELWHKSP